MPELPFVQPQDARVFTESIVNTVRESLLVLDEHLHIVSANSSFYQTFKVSEQETVGKRVYQVGNGQWDIPRLRELLETIIPQNTQFRDFEVEHIFPAIGQKTMLLNARRIDQPGERREFILLAIEDITDRIRARRALEDSEAKYHKFVEYLNSIIIGFDAAGTIIFFNYFAERLFGYRREEVLGKEFVGTIIPRRESSGKDNSGLAADTIQHPEKHYINENEGLKKNGDRIWFSWSAKEVRDRGGRVVEILIDGNDLTPERERNRFAREAYTLLENTLDLAVRFDVNKKYVFANKAAAELVRRPKEQIIGKTLGELGSPPETVEILNRTFEDVLQTKQTQKFESKYGDRHFETVMVPELDTKGDVVSFMMFARDYTDAKRAEEELRRREEEFRALSENIPAIIARFDRSFCHVYVNRAAAQATGIPADRMIGKTNKDLGLPDDTVAFWHEHFQKVFDTKQEDNIEFSFEGPKGKRTYQSHIVPEFNQQGDVETILAITRDATQSKKAEEELHASKDFTDKILATSLTGLYIYDWQKQIITFINAQYTRLTGYTLEELTELSRQGSFFDLFHPDDKEKVLAYARAMGNIREDETREVEYRFRSKEGDWRWFLSRATLFSRNSDGTLHEYIGSFIDITERKKIEQALTESRSSLLRAQAIAHIGSWKLDVKTNIASCSDEFFRILGIPRPEIYTYNDFEKSVHPDDRAVPRNAIAEIVRSQKYAAAEFRVVRPDGEVRYIHAEGDFSVENGNDITYGTFQDITERKRVEQVLRENREDLNRAQAVGHIGSWRLNTRRNELLWSDEVYAIFEIPKETPLTYETFLSFIHPDDRQYVDREWNAALKGEPYDIEHRIIVGSETKWVREKAELDSDQTGTLLGGFGIVQDITDRKKAEEAVRIREAQLNAFFDSSPGILNLHDENICYINTDKRTPTFFGLTRETIKGKCVKDLAPGIISQLGDMVRQVLDTGETKINVETPISGLGSPGEMTHWRASYFRVPLGDGKWGLGIVGVEITDLKKAEDTLRRNEYEMRTLVDNSPDLIFRLNRQMQYVYANPAYERLTGILRDQFLGKTNRELGMSPQLIEFWQSAVQGVLDSGREHSLEFDMSSIFGKRYFFARLIPEFAKTGLVETVLVIARDITERKRAEEQIRYISFHDEVTGLFNRAFFEEEIHRVDTERDLPISIIMGDVNNLKLSNDVFGHEEGDKLLKAVADIFRKACRNNDIIARWGGDEFAVILPRTDSSTAAEVCSRVQQTAKESKGTVIQPGVALGVATKEIKDQNIYQTIRQAEERMYNNKLAESRKNEDIVFFSLFDCARDRNPDLDTHIERSNALADAFGRELALSENQRDDLRLLIKLHDIGDAVIPEEILKKPGRLTPAEWEIMKKHSEAGLRIVKTFVDTARISDEVFSHGERWDGTGYPRGLKEKEIPYLARVFQVIDVFDVITHPRPYARTFAQEGAIEELRRNAGRQFDPELTEIFLRMLTKEPAAPTR